MYKKGSKLECSNCWTIFLLSNIENALEKLIYSRLYSFLENKLTLEMLCATWYHLYNLKIVKDAHGGVYF